MAWLFDENNDDVQLSDNAALTFPDADWSLGGWIKLTDNTGNSFQYFISWGAFDATPSLNVYIREESESSSGNRINCRARDNDGTIFQTNDTATGVGTSRIWQYIMLVRSGTTLTVYVDNVSTGIDDLTGFDAIDLSTAFYFGARSDENADRRFGGDMAEWAKWDRALNSAERAALTAGASPAHYPRGRTWYVPMIRQYRELDHRIVVTNDGSVVSTHPRIVQPSARILQFLSAATGTAFFQTVTGALTPIGAIVKETQKAVSGSIAPAGVVVRDISMSLAGSVTPTGVVAKETRKSFTGALTPAGALSAVATFISVVAGALTPAGTIVKQTQKAVSGAVSPTGTTAKTTAKQLSGTVEPSGELTPVTNIKQTILGALTPSGVLSTIFTLGGPIDRIRRRMLTMIDGFQRRRRN